MRTRCWLLIGAVMLVVGLVTMSALAAAGHVAKPPIGYNGRGQGVEVRARVAGQIVLSIESGDAITFEVDPLNNPEDAAQTELSVMTNAPKYSIIATFGKFVIGNYDLIAHKKFFVKSKAPKDGQAITNWTVPPEGQQMVVLKDESGLTMGETTVVEYKLTVDFSVPAGEGKLDISFTAVAAL